MRTPALQGIHDRIYIGLDRQPTYKVWLYDQSETFSNIVLGRPVNNPLDLTGYVEEVSIEESEDGASSASIKIDPGSDLSPYYFVGRPVIRIYYGDVRTLAENETDWFVLFTGVCVGQPGFVNTRDGAHIINVKAIDRSFFYNKRRLETPSYTQDTDFGDICTTIATNTSYGMGLQREECRFGVFGQTVKHTVVAFMDVMHMEALQGIGFVADDRLVPGFDGEGYLVFRDTTLTKPPVRKYSNTDLFQNITWPQTQVELYNRVRIKGLASQQSKVVSPLQKLATVTGTIGYFQDKWRERIYYGEDRQSRAQNLVISEYSVNGNLSFVPGDARLKNIGEFSCVLEVKSPYAPWIFFAWAGGYIILILASEAIPYPPAQGALRVAASIWLAAGLIVMQQIGSFEVTISGEPYKYVYQEIEGTASWENLEDYEVRELEIENHLIDTQTMADTLALRELEKERIKQNARNFPMPHDPMLEVTDIIELPDGTLYYITSISRRFKRGEEGTMDVTALMFRSGREYNQVAGFSPY